MPQYNFPLTQRPAQMNRRLTRNDATLLDQWQPTDFAVLEKGVLQARHRLVETGLFSDQALADLIDRHPDDQLTIGTMGHDTNHFQWREGDRNGVPGETILELVKQGHLWLSLRRVMDHHRDLRRLVNQLYDELQQQAAGFHARQRTANLLISSPHALVHYHIDMPVNMLWHLRGRKRVWVYPHFDHRFVSPEVIELVCAGRHAEDVPYSPDLDRYALVFDVEPGQLLTWPQLTPHRVTNLEGLNVSLSTEHKNARAIRRLNVYQANHLLRRWCRRPCRSTDIDGLVACLKETLVRTQRLAHRVIGKRQPQFSYPHSFVVDPESPRGVCWLDETEGREAAAAEAVQNSAPAAMLTG